MYTDYSFENFISLPVVILNNCKNQHHTLVVTQ